MNKGLMQIKYLGNIDQMDINILMTSLLNIANILEEINQNILPDRKLKINISAVEKGSFIINLNLTHKLISNVIDFINNKDIQSVTTVLSILTGVLYLKEKLKGKKPQSIEKKDDKIIINGNITVNKDIYNIYSKNKKVNEYIQKTFESITEEPSIDGFTIEPVDIDVEKFTVSRDEFSDMISENDIFLEEEKIVIKENVKLEIIKLVFDKTRKWEFVYDGFKISANIEDIEFLDKVSKSIERFGKGDILISNIKIIQIFDENNNVFINKNFTLLKVKEHKIIEKEKPLF
ncbi:MAG: hypothetical protein ACYCT7_00615 [bacterium]